MIEQRIEGTSKATRSTMRTVACLMVFVSTLQHVESQTQQESGNNVDDCLGRNPIGIGSGSGIRGGANGRLCNGRTPPSSSMFPGVPLSKIRSIDGSGEDIRGSAGSNLVRLTPCNYPDGPAGNSMATEPNARMISNLVSNNNLMAEMIRDEDGGGNRRRTSEEGKSDM